MFGDQLPLLALSDIVVTGVGLLSIAMAGAVVLLGLRRRETGYDPMLIVSAIVVVALAIAILATR